MSTEGQTAGNEVRETILFKNENNGLKKTKRICISVMTMMLRSM